LQLPNKPQIPPSTPAPGPNGRLNAYSSVSSQYCGTQSSIYDTPGVANPKRSTIKANNSTISGNSQTQSQTNMMIAKKIKRTHGQCTKRISVESLTSQTSLLSKTSSMNTTLTEIVRDLPFDDREKVTSLVNMAVYSSECFQKECHAISIELKSLKASYRVKYGELNVVCEECDVYRTQIAAMEEKLNTLEDDAESRQNYALRNSKAISRLSSTNKTLIDAFALIHEENPKKKTTPEGKLTSTNNNAVKLSPIGATNTKKMRKKEGKTNPNAIDPYEGTPVTSNEKLRERLLRVAKEHNRVEKNCEGLESKIMGLRSSLRVAERRNRQLQLELDELKEHLSSENSGKHSPAQMLTTASFSSKLIAHVVKPQRLTSERKYKRVPMTNRLNALVSRNAFDATEGIKQIDALISHLANTPSTMIEADIAFHLCTRYACRLFDSEAMVLYILQPGGKVMHRYATGAEHVMILEVGDQPSITENTMRTGAMRRYNNNIRSNSFFNPTVDGIDTINTKRVLTFPLRNQDKTLVVGVMHLLNKRNNNKFTEVDELYGSAFSDVLGGFFSSSILFKRLWLESETLCGIMRASRMLLESLPPVTSLVAARPLLPEEVLYSLEHVVRNSLKCSQAKAFLLSKHCGYQEEFFISLEKPSIGMMALKPEHLACHNLPIHSGIAGHVAFTKTPYLVSDPSADALFNTQIDICSECETFYCVPLLNVAREVIAIIQVVPSALSPNLKSSQEMGDSTVAFENAIDWLLYLLSANFTFMVDSIGSPLARPDIQYLEPITLTEKFATMNISLQAAPLEEDENLIHSKPGSPTGMECGRQRSRTIDEVLDEQDLLLYENGESNQLESGEVDQMAEDENDKRPQSGDVAEKYERQIKALEAEIEVLKTLNAAEMDDCEEEELRIRNLLQDEYTSKYASELATRKSAVKTTHDNDVAKRRESDRELELLREHVAHMTLENEKAEEDMREEERKKDQVSLDIISSIQQMDSVEVGKDDPASGEHEEHDHEHHEHDEYEEEEQKANQTPDSNHEAAMIDTDAAVMTSARSNRSNRSEIPPTPTKEEVESSPRIGNWMEAFDHDGHKYYYNAVTEESSWEKPTGFVEVTAVDDTYVDDNDDDAEAKDVVRIGEWTQATTDDGHVYWIHDITGESTWDTPTDDIGSGSSSLLDSHNPKGHSQSAPVLSQYAGKSKVTAGDYSIEL
jgi:hypothetical protein